MPCETIFNTHQSIYRCALVGIGKLGNQRPVIVAEPWPDRRPTSEQAPQQLVAELRALAQTSPLTQPIEDFLLHPSLPVDIRHNAKIGRGQLAAWAKLKVKL